MEQELSNYISADIVKHIMRPLLSKFFILRQDHNDNLGDAYIVLSTEEDAERLRFNMNCLEDDEEFDERKHDALSRWSQNFRKWVLDEIELSTLRKVMDEAIRRNTERHLRDYDFETYWKVRGDKNFDRQKARNRRISI